MPVVAKCLTSVLCRMSCLLMASQHIGNFLLASGLSHANGHMMPLQSCVDVDVEGNAETLHFIQKACHLQYNNNQFNSHIPHSVFETAMLHLLV